MTLPSDELDQGAPRRVRRYSRAGGAAAIAAAWEAGEHLTMIGPTGRGKSTLLAQVLPASRHDLTVVLCPKGSDKAFAGLGEATMTWPPSSGNARARGLVQRLRMAWREPVDPEPADRRKVWRVEIPIQDLSAFERVAAVYRAVLAETLARTDESPGSVAVVLDDSRLISQHLNLDKLVTANMLIARSKRASMVNMYQAPRWVPREGLDQATHVVMWRNRDRDVVRRLGEIADVDPKEIAALLAGLGFHEALWVNGRDDSLSILGS